MNISLWAAKWGVPPEAVRDLQAQFGTVSTEPVKRETALSEAAVQNRIRVEAAQKGARVWRNNIGAYMDDYGNFIRYGLCNDSKQMNKKIKSSDLIGIRPVLITPEHVGATLGVFMAREIKPGGWVYRGDAHELAQLKFLQLVASLGGDACFATREGTI